MSDTKKEAQPVKDHRQVDREAEEDVQERVRRAVAAIKWPRSAESSPAPEQDA